MLTAIKLRIELENTSFISDNDIIYSIIRTNLEEKDLHIEIMFSRYFKKVPAFFQIFADLLKTVNRNLKVHNMIPLKVEPVNHNVNITPIIPATVIKGLLRYSYDVKTAVKNSECYDIDYISSKILRNIILPYEKYIRSLIKSIHNTLVKPLKIGDKLPTVIEELFIENHNFPSSYNLSKEHKLCLVLLSYVLALQSYNSCLSIIDEISCSLPLSESSLKIRKLLTKIFGRKRSYTLCKSCLVFGCSGFKTPIILFDAKPVSDVRLIVRTFNNICQPRSDREHSNPIAKTVPFTYIGFDKDVIFETKIILRKTYFYELSNKFSIREHGLKYEDLVIEVLKEAVENISKSKLGCIITFGRRGSAGYGSAFIRINSVEWYY